MTTSESLTLSRRRLLGGVVALGGASAAAGAGTVARFTDATTSENDVVAGTLALSAGGTGTFAFSTALGPTETTQDAVTLVNDGTLAGSLDVDVAYDESDASPNSTDVSAGQVSQRLEVTTLSYGGSDLTDRIDATNSPPTLEDLATNDPGGDETTANTLLDLPDPGAGTDFTVGFRLQDVGDDYQADGVSVTFTFTLNQTDAM